MANSGDYVQMRRKAAIAKYGGSKAKKKIKKLPKGGTWGKG